MSEAIRLYYEKRPSAIIGLLKAFWGMNLRYDPQPEDKGVNALWENVAIIPDHVTEFRHLCGIESANRISIIYPLTLVFPLVIRVLGHSRAPLTIFRSLNTKTRIIQHHEIKADDRMEISCRLDQRRIVEKGLELDLVSSLKSKGKVLWESVQTFYYRGRYGEADPVRGIIEMAAIPDATIIGEWFLPKGIGYRFAKICGDTNGIHYNANYARLLGFEQDFAQPMLLLPKALECIPEKEKGTCLEVCFKGPVYYDRQITVRGMVTDAGFRFNLYAEGNARPCICGLMGNKGNDL